jgi:Amt family ammonium transporter
VPNRTTGWLRVIPGLLVLTTARGALADELSAGDTAWMLTSSALVLMMTLPGLALFYGGLVRSKNVLSVLMQCLISAGVMGLLWIVVGYSLAFSGEGAFIGNLDKVGLRGITPDTLSGTIPEYVFVVFQGMFAMITPALMLGAFAERMRFAPFLAFITIWLFLVYIPLAHMVWSGEHGYFWAMGAIDFAGGLVVHMSSGFSALIGCIILGPRRGYGKDMFLPHSLPLTVIGAALLWVGWFGFNAGSAAGANGTAGLAFITTNTATATALVAWVFIEWLHRGKPTVLGGATAAVAGLVAITPACASVTPIGAIWVGLGAAAICYAAVTLLKPRLGYDDSLDVFGVHGVGGAWGALATGLFIAPAALADAGTSWGGQVFIQLKSIVIVAFFAMSVSALILFALKAVFGNLRVTDEAESQGLDVHEHSETAYTG